LRRVASMHRTRPLAFRKAPIRVRLLRPNLGEPGTPARCASVRAANCAVVRSGGDFAAPFSSAPPFFFAPPWDRAPIDPPDRVDHFWVAGCAPKPPSAAAILVFGPPDERFGPRPSFWARDYGGTGFALVPVPLAISVGNLPALWGRQIFPFGPLLSGLSSADFQSTPLISRINRNAIPGLPPRSGIPRHRAVPGVFFSLGPEFFGNAKMIAPSAIFSPAPTFLRALTRGRSSASRFLEGTYVRGAPPRPPWQIRAGRDRACFPIFMPQ